MEKTCIFEKVYVMIILQRVKKVNGWDILNAAMVFNIHNNQVQFAVTPTQTGM
jgi:hypothetical protein